MVGKLATIVIGQGLHPVFVWSKALCDGMANGLGHLSVYGLDERIQRLTLDQLHQGTPMALANHSITFPVTKTLACIDNGWSSVNRCLIWDDAAPVVGTIAFTASLLAAQFRKSYYSII